MLNLFSTLSVCMTILGWVFMISVGFNAAASVRVSNELGAGHPKSSAFAVVVVTTSSFILAVIIAIVMLLLRHVISYVFTGGSTVADAVSELSPYLAISIVLNGVQPVLSGVAVGCGWQAFLLMLMWDVTTLLVFLWGAFWASNSIWVQREYGQEYWIKEVENARNRLDRWDNVTEPLLKDQKD
ncbi:hypothetical protein LWI29_011220 [Acer saccharum]|uniref:Uncharacterized protein n=1 Tax=Acer saccharum TaxID=4024 RepID=A0AA39VFR4_ACESA|nr:hypothetical protein LWI29_011220 [Acer saccharum]